MTLINDKDKDDRPREKLIKYGPKKLTDAELLALILRSGPHGVGVVDFSRNVLRRFGKKELPNTSVEDLMKYKGLGKAKACQIVACFELQNRLVKDKQVSISSISPQEIWETLRPIHAKQKEYFYVFYLDSRNQEIARDFEITKNLVSMGTVNASLVHPREVFERAIKHNAVDIILAHNHPSNKTDPSDQDITVTRRLSEAGNILGIQVIDHIIVSKSGYFSFREQNLID